MEILFTASAVSWPIKTDDCHHAVRRAPAATTSFLLQRFHVCSFAPWTDAVPAPFASLHQIAPLGSLTIQSRSLVMAFLVRLRIFHDQPARGPLACCGHLADAFG
jgi:hypothetical protein